MIGWLLQVETCNAVILYFLITHWVFLMLLILKRRDDV